jgi:hypothetical protein
MTVVCTTTLVLRIVIILIQCIVANMMIISITVSKEDTITIGDFDF